MADLTTEEIAELRRRVARYATRPYFYDDRHEQVWNALPALLDMAERCAMAEAELARHRAEAERFDSEDWTYDWGDA